MTLKEYKIQNKQKNPEAAETMNYLINWKVTTLEWQK
jgi:hypothetical protein